MSQLPDQYIDAAFIPSAPDMATDYLAERLKRKTDNLEHEVGRVSVGATQAGIYGNDFNEIKAQSDRIASDAMVNIITSGDEEKDRLRDESRLDSDYPEALNQKTLASEFERLQNERKGDDKIIFMFIDLDKFKYINDTYGHSAGDTVISATIDKLKEASRTGDAVGRMGGEELGLAADIDGADDQALSNLIGRIIEPVEADGITSTRSVGVVVAERGESFESVKAKGDEAMYFVKQAGRNNAAIWSADGNHQIVFPSSEVV